MAQTVLCGTDLEVQQGLYGGVSPTTYEEGTTNGMGMRQTAARSYTNWFTEPFSGTGKGTAQTNSFNSGHAVVVSVSNPARSPGPASFTLKKVITGIYDTDINAMFDRMFALPFDSNVTTLTRSCTTNGTTTLVGAFSGADVGASITGTGIPVNTTIVSQTVTSAVMSNAATNSATNTMSIIQGLTQPYVYFIFWHEIDKATLPSGDVPADYIAAWQYLHGKAALRATAAGVPASRVRWCFNITSWAMPRGDAYYPGSAYVDVLGYDPYTGPTNPSSFTAMNTTVSPIWADARKKNKPICYPEINMRSAPDSSAAASWWVDVATQINALDVVVEFICIWIVGTNQGSTYPQYDIQKVAGADVGGNAFPLKHAGIVTMFTNLGANAIRSGVTQALPSAPVVSTATSNAAGTTLTMPWAAPPGGDNVTGWDAYIASGTTVNLHKDNQGGVLAATPRSYTFSGLTPGSPYSYSVVAINSAGRSGFGNIPTSSTITPGVGLAPVISAATAVPETANPLLVDVTATASDPGSLALTYQWTFTNTTTGNITNFTGATGTVTFLNPGTHTFTVAVTNTIPKTTTQSGSFAINLSAVNTANFNWPMPQAGQDVRTLAPQMRGWMPDLDTRLFTVSTAQNNANSIHGLVASSFDPVSLSTSTSNTPASGNFIWTGMKLEGTTITGLVTVTTTAQVGTGVVVGFYNANGGMITQDDGITLARYSGAGVDAWLAGAASVQPVSFSLAAPITTRTYGEVIYVGIYFPTLATYPALRVTVAPAYVAKLNQASTPRFGLVTGQSTAPDPIPFASWTTNFLPFFMGIF